MHCEVCLIDTAVEKSIASAILVCLSPLLGMIALAIKVEGLLDQGKGPSDLDHDPHLTRGAL